MNVLFTCDPPGGIVAVSYTHLDVYKRQQYNRNAGGETINTMNFVNKGASTSGIEPKRQTQEDKKKNHAAQ